MSSTAKMVQWHNGMQNHQKGHPLPVLDPKVTGAYMSKGGKVSMSQDGKEAWGWENLQTPL